MSYPLSLTEDRGTNGNLGGHVDQVELIGTLLQNPDLAQFRDALGPLIQGFVDLPTATGDGGTSCENPEGAVGVGFGFEAVRAVIAAIASGPVPGMCGAP